ncbi:hypothetical protein NBRC111894_2772 [Sporolactobacillus inulinus]|uniref:Lipoprotein n=1 Tax=Sporolactobacillus inulinus TaxID=2078 RepID=A0A4Y1ZFG3_9BACL|nr:hypothetical protein NBRC111894_2772 [Sporolactobacillus inulinus]
MKKKLFAVSSLVLMAALLAGCTDLNKPINDSSTGFGVSGSFCRCLSSSSL